MVAGGLIVAGFIALLAWTACIAGARADEADARARMAQLAEQFGDAPSRRMTHEAIEAALGKGG